jgi:hypothetical protein
MFIGSRAYNQRLEDLNVAVLLEGAKYSAPFRELSRCGFDANEHGPKPGGL